MTDKIKSVKIIKWGVCLLIFLLPWQTRWIFKAGELNGGVWEYGTYSLYGTEILLWLLVIMKIVSKRIINYQLSPPTGDHQRGEIINYRKLLHYYIITLLFLMWAVLSVLWAEDSMLALYWWLRLLEGLLCFWLIISTKVDFRKVAGVIIASATIQAILGIWQFLSQGTFASKWLGLALHLPGELGVSIVEVGLERWLRAYGSLLHPNILGGWLTLGLVLCVGLYDFLYRALWNGSRNKKQETRNKDKILLMILLLCYVVMLSGLLCTFSRGAWVATFICLLIYLFINLFKKDKIGKVIAYKLLIISVLVMAIFGFIFREPFMARVTGEGRLEVKSNQERVTGIEEGLAVIKKNWVGGVGLGNYTLYLYNSDANLRMQANDINVKYAWDYQPVHNLYLLVLAELGIVGLMFFIAIILSIINYQLLIIKRAGQENWALNPFIILIAVIILSFFDHYFWSLYFGIMFWWLVLGLTIFSFSFNIKDS